MKISNKRTDPLPKKGLYRVIIKRYKEPFTRYVAYREYDFCWMRYHGEDIECWLEQQEVEPCQIQPE